MYLVTAPRFLGYSFNPVSFWYFYSKDKVLKAMILEVNNTFDERRMYLLKGEIKTPGLPPPVERQILESSRNDALPSTQTEGTAKFSDNWAKDFHVSPFSSRKGSYSMSAYDPFSQHSTRETRINNTITLSSSKNHAKLVARIFSTQDSIDPSTMSRWLKARFFCSWWWVGLVTYPRIVKEAGKLYFWRNLDVWFRPEVFKDSIGRTETYRERYIVIKFRLASHANLHQHHRGLLQTIPERACFELAFPSITPLHCGRYSMRHRGNFLSKSSTPRTRQQRTERRRESRCDLLQGSNTTLLRSAHSPCTPHRIPQFGNPAAGRENAHILDFGSCQAASNVH